MNTPLIRAAAPSPAAAKSGEARGASGAAKAYGGGHQKDILYTCPMHPEIRQMGPGSCPKCGMALEPDVVAAQEEENPELTDFRRRLKTGLWLGLPVVMLDIGEHFSAMGAAGQKLSHWIAFVLGTIVVFGTGRPFFVRAAHSVKNKSPNMFTLIALGVGAAWVYSAVAVVAPSLFPPALRKGGMPDVYFETAAVIILLVLLGQILELKARQKTSRAVRALLDLAPKTAWRIEDSGKEAEIAVDCLSKGDVLRLRTGERVPVDGTVLDGTSYVEESMITGEAAAVKKEKGDRLIAGTVNTTGSLLFRAEKVGAETLLAQIVRMVASAQRSRPAVARLADKVSRFFVLAVFGVAGLTFLVWAAAADISFGLLSAVSVLVVACPCALGLATPMSVMVGIGRGAQEGILVRDAAALELMEKVDTLVLDKTGTLTKGAPQLVRMEALTTRTPDDLLRIAAALERHSSHPLGAAILKAAADKNLTIPAAGGFQSFSGEGIEATVEGRTVRLGRASFVGGETQAPALEARAAALRTGAQTVLFMAEEGETVAAIVLDDPLKEGAAETLGRLRRMGIDIVMATGDHETAARAVGAALGITKIHAAVLPQDKGRIVESLRKEGRIVAMAGDGINDAPALALAHVGLAMGGGADIAMETAAITLLHGSLAGIARAVALSRATMRNIRQNLFFAFVYNGAGIPLAAGVLYPLWGFLLSPMAAGVIMALSSLSVVGNALRLRRSRI